MVRRLALLCSMTLAACSVGLDAPASAVITCTTAPDCPSGLVCVIDIGRCTSPGTACVEQRNGAYYAAADGNACSAQGREGGVCKSGVCTFCGNGAIEAGEGCDDGNTDEHDGCTSQCLIAVCGDSITTPLAETCDDGNTNDNDACANCQAVHWQAEVAFGLGPRRSGLTSTTLPNMSALAVTRYGAMYVANNDDAGSDLGFAASDAPGAVWLVSETADAIVRVAGTGNPSSTEHPEQVLARNEDLGPVTGLAADAQGVLYLSEGGTQHQHILSVTTDGQLHIVAGAGPKCPAGVSMCGDEGLARVATLYGPGPLTFDQRGYLYFVDGSTIRYIDDRGFIHRAAGTGAACDPAKGCDVGGAQASNFGTIAGLTFTSDNALYVTDDFAGNAAGRVVRIAGGQAAVAYSNLKNPGAIITLPGDILTLIDRNVGSDVVLRADTQASFTGGAKCSDPQCGDGGPAISAGAKALQSLALDASGRVVVVDSGLQAIRRIDTQGVIRRVLGSYQVTQSFTGARGTGTTISPRAAAANANGDVVVANGKQVFVWRAATELVEFVAGYICDTCGVEGPVDQVQFGGISDVAVDGETIYVLDQSTDPARPLVRQVKKISGGVVSTFAGTALACAPGCEGAGNTVADAKTLTFDEAIGITTSPGYVWVTSRISVWRIDTSTGAAVRYAGGQVGHDTTDVAPAAAHFNCPYDIAVTGSDVFIADTYNCAVRRIRGSTVTTIRDLASGACPATPQATCGRPDAQTCLGYPTGVATDGSTLYYAEGSCAVVYKASVTGGEQTVIAGGGSETVDGTLAKNASMPRPRIALSPQGRVLVFSAAQGNESGRVRAIDSDIIRTLVGNVDLTFSGPFSRSEIGVAGQAVMFAPDAALLLDASRHVVRRVNFTTSSLDPVFGGVPGVALSGLVSGVTAPSRYIAPPTGARGIAYDPLKKTLYLSASSGLAKIVIGKSTDGTDWTTSNLTIAGAASGPAITPTPSIDELALDANGTKLYALDTEHSVVRLVDLVSGVATIIAGHVDFIGADGDGGPAIDATLNTPQSIAIADSGALYIADQNNNRVRRISTDGIIDTVLGTGVASSQGVDGMARDLPVDSPVGLAFDAFGNLVVAGRGTVRVVLKSGTNASGEPDGSSNVTNIYDVTDYPAQADLISCLKAPFRGATADVLFVGDACTGAVIKLQRQ